MKEGISTIFEERGSKYRLFSYIDEDCLLNAARGFSVDKVAPESDGSYWRLYPLWKEVKELVRLFIQSRI